MNGGAIIFMIFGMVFLWGGLTVSVLNYVKIDKQMSKEDSYM